jgi:hypothetical protein
MEPREEMLHCLLLGLAPAEQVFVLQRIERAREEQLDRKRNPQRRRRRRPATGDGLPVDATPVGGPSTRATTADVALAGGGAHD